MALLGSEEIEARLAELSGWERRGEAIVKAFGRGDFVGSVRSSTRWSRPPRRWATTPTWRSPGTR